MLIKQLLRDDYSSKMILVCAGAGSYLLRQKHEQTYKLYLLSLSKEVKRPLLTKYGNRFRGLFPADCDLEQALENWEQMVNATLE